MGIHGDVFYEDRIAIPFTSLPPAASNDGRVMRCQPLVAGQGYFYMVSDGTYWRPYGGEQKLYILDAPLNMAVNNTVQKLLTIPIPAMLIPCGRTYLKVVVGCEKLLGTSDTLNVTQKMGPLDTSSDPNLFGTTLATTQIAGGATNEASRMSSTTVRKHGKGNAFDSSAVSGIGTVATPAAITVGNMDSVVNYLGVYGQMTTGSTEYGSIHSLTVEIMG